ncbi:MAG TPA: GGDEF domain-containing protein, partial [Thermoleophilaceae bacterium]
LSTLLLLAVAALGGGEAVWLCVPAALVLARAARTPGQAYASAAVAAIASVVPALAGHGALPSLPLVAIVVGSSTALLVSMRSRLEHERDAQRATSLRDPLTGLANRRAFDERLAYEAARHTRQSRTFAVVALDLDGFKSVNDRFGHQAGDDVLRDVAVALDRAVREQDTVARMGGDEFCVLAPETDRAGAEHLADRAEQAVRNATRGLAVLSASVGVGMFPEDGREAAQVLEAADAAALYAKRQSRRARQRAA